MLVQLSSDVHYLTCKSLDNFLFLAEKSTNFCIFASPPFFVIEINSPVTCQLICTYAFFTCCCYFYYYPVRDADVYFYCFFLCCLRFLMEYVRVDLILCLFTLESRITDWELVFNLSFKYVVE